MTLLANDERLLSRFRAGDRDALSAVYSHYVEGVERFVRWHWEGARCIGHGLSGRVDSADLVQEVFVKAFAERARLAYDPSRAYRPFLAAIARNTVIDHVRGARREIATDGARIDSLLVSGSEGESIGVTPWTDPQTMLLVERYVARLAIDERAVFVERYCRSRSQVHAAAALGISRQQVRTLESRLRAGLAREIARTTLCPRVGAEEKTSTRPLAPSVLLPEPGGFNSRLSATARRGPLSEGRAKP